MVDFAKLLAEHRARMTPEERDRADKAELLRAQIETTAQPIHAVFEVLGWKAKPVGLAALKAGTQPEKERHVTRTYSRDVIVQIEPRDDGRREVIQFCGAVTGHEAFELTSEMCQRLAEDSDERWYICGGRPESYHACSVAIPDVVAYLREKRPTLFADHAPAP